VIRLLLVDDHALLRAGLAALLATADGGEDAGDDGDGDRIEVVGQAGDGREAVQVALELRPDVVLMDLSMPVMDGATATRALLAALPGVAVVALTSFSERARVREAIDAGAVGYLLKDSEPRVLIDGVRAAARGEAPLDPRVARALLPDADPGSSRARLSPREREVLALVGRGMANKQIARALGIAERTVKVHLTSVFRSLGVSDRTSAAIWARENL
jgi:DNA-binding NarL/FixJ family response regulator